MEILDKMKKIASIFLLAPMLLPAALYITLLIINSIPTKNRKYEAVLNRIGWRIQMEEQNSDSLLYFHLKHTRKSKTDSISLIINNNYCGDVISLVLTEYTDTVFVRKGCEFKELFPPEEQSLYPVAPKDYYVDNPVVKISSKCKMVAFSDPRFFIYDKEKCTYIPKDDITHLIKLSHYTERGESYNLCDITHSDTLGITFEQKH